MAQRPTGRAAAAVTRPSARVAMVGAGQLARMTHQAAVDLDVELTVLAGSDGDPAVLAGAPHRLGGHTDAAALAALAGDGDVVTFDHELVPPALLADLEAAGHRLRPGPAALAMAQDKVHARRVLSDAGYPVPAFAVATGPGDVERFAAAHGWPVVLKARSGGYDGRGVLVAGTAGDVPADLEWGGAGEPRWLVEEHLELAAELAVLVARSPSGEVAVYPPVQTTQVGGICRHLVVPSPLPPAVGAEAADLARGIVEGIAGTGICAVELFVAGGHRILVNELALRPHNSGHATIEANVTSQFHQHLRAVLDWPLGPAGLVAPAAAMVNLITPSADADPAANLPAALAVPGANVHLYAKASRPGRKVGHVTVLAATVGAALDAATSAAGILLRQ
jgi:5-(carboxyamino)imidazole ribonucleotide synthase